MLFDPRTGEDLTLTQSAGSGASELDKGTRPVDKQIVAGDGAGGDTPRG